MIRVLFLCTGNSARSIIAEALLNARGQGRFEAFSAGSHPRGTVHPLAVDVLRRHHIPVDDHPRSKSWHEFSTPGGPSFDVVVTVCDRAAGEVCPVWQGDPIKIHWSIDDPAGAVGSEEEKARAFDTAFRELEARIAAFIASPPV